MKLLNRGAIIVDFKRLNVFRRFPAMIELRDSSVLDPGTTPELYKLWERLVCEESAPMVDGTAPGISPSGDCIDRIKPTSGVMSSGKLVRGINPIISSLKSP